MNFTIAGFNVTGPWIMLGLITGMLYGILGVGLILIYRSSRIINFAYGDIGAFGAAVLGVAVRQWGVPYWISFVIAIGAAAGVGAASEVLIMRRLRAAPLVISVIATLGLGQVLQIMATIVSTAGGHGIGLGAQSTFPNPSGLPQFRMGALLVTPAYSAMLILTPFVVAAVILFLRRGRLGVALRATASNTDAARMAGMATGKLSALSWAIAGAVAGYTAILVLPARGFTSSEFLGPDLLLRGLLCAVVGRMTNMPAALASGLGLGVVEALLNHNYTSSGITQMVVFVIILAVLLVQRSTGFTRTEEKGTWSAVQPFAPLPRSYLRVPAIRNLGWIAGSFCLIAALAIPELTSNTNATIFSLIVVIGLVGLSVTIVAGLAGQLSLGQFGVAAVGAGTTYQAMHHGTPFVLAVVAAAAAGAIVSLIIGLPALRIRGLMLAVVTLGFALAADDWLVQQPWMFGPGANTRRPKLGGFAFDTDKRYYLVAFAVLLVALWMARNVWTGSIGRQLRAVRDNEEAARAFTIRATAVKLHAFVLSGLIAGLAGAVYSSLLSQQGTPAYPIDLSTNAVASSVIGGLGLLVGPFIGTLYIIGFPRWVTFLGSDNVGLAASSAGWLLLILFNPGGLAQGLARHRDQLVDFLARRAGLDPADERDVTPGGGLFAPVGGIDLPEPAVRTVPHGEVLLRAEGLTKTYGGLRAVNGVSLDVVSGEILGLIGPNGAGKTTFFELLSGFNRPDLGAITFEGRDITKTRPELRAKTGLIRSFQDAALFPTMTVHEVLMVSLERVQPTRFVKGVTGLAGAVDRRKAQRADELLALMGLLSFRDSKISELSTGTRRITEIACLIALEPVLLLLDEPTSGIAQRETEALGDVLLTIQDQLDLTMVIIEHDIPLIMGLSDRVAAMVSGQIITVDAPSVVQANPVVVESYLGGDIAAIERSDRAPAAPSSKARPPTVPADRPPSPTCLALTRSGKACSRPAGPDGICTQHRKVLSRS